MSAVLPDYLRQGNSIRYRGVQTLALLDYVVAVLAWMIFWNYRIVLLGKASFMTAWQYLLPRDIFYGFVLLPLGWMLLYLLSGTYFDVYRKSRLYEINRTLISSLIGCVIVALFVFADDAADYSWFISMTGRYLLIHTAWVLTSRMLLFNAIKRKLATGKAGFNTLIIGGNDNAIGIYQQIGTSPVPLGNIFKGFIYSNKESSNGMSHYLPKLGTLDDLEQIIDEQLVEEVIIAVDSSEHHLLQSILTRLSYRPVYVKVLADTYDIISGTVKTSNVYDIGLIHIDPSLMPDWQRVCKRCIDIISSSLAMLLLMPVYLFAAIKVKLSSQGPVFYTQERIGLLGKPFPIFKFRSMYVDAEKAGPALSSDEDPRITPWGRIMRKWRIDELPQFFNILRGDMSLVGPRPERRYFIDLISETRPHYKYLHKVKPGLTSWGMVKYGYAENVGEMIQRMKYDLLYIENCSLALDIKIMCYTLIVIFQGRGK